MAYSPLNHTINSLFVKVGFGDAYSIWNWKGPVRISQQLNSYQ
jgi:hypothetical protein